jgi:XTP/dITP diphosphohydrolase
MRIILATHNKHKVTELSELAKDHMQFEVLPDDFPDIEETGASLQENALLKARFVYNELGIPSLADDTGLEVSALEGAPGVMTARFAGENATYKDNCLKLLKELNGKSDRRAVFKTVLCFIDSEGSEYFFEGVVEGNISNEEQGSGGFGYDPVFIPQEDSLGRTFAEMNSEEKNRISHRGRASRSFLTWLEAHSEPKAR